MSMDRKLDFIIGEDKNLAQLLDASEAIDAAGWRRAGRRVRRCGCR